MKRALPALLAGAVFAVLQACSRETLPRGGIVSMGPNITETIFALGQGNRVSAVDSFTDFPPEARVLPRVGGYIDPNLERITLIRPELIVLAGRFPKVMEFAEPRKMRTLVVAMDSLATIDAGIATLGVALECTPAADRLRAQIANTLDAVRAAAAGRPRPRVLIITGRSTHDLNDLATAGGASFVSEIVACAGGDNIYANVAAPYFEASKESVVAEAPEVILEFHAGEGLNASDKAAFVADWDAMPILPAVQDKRIYLLTESHALRPGPRIGEIARRMVKLLHPEAELPE